MRETNIDRLPPIPALTRDQTCELFGVRDGAPTSRATQPGGLSFLEVGLAQPSPALARNSEWESGSSHRSMDHVTEAWASTTTLATPEA